MGTARPYPLDFDALQKGDTIGVEEIEDIVRLKYGKDVNYGLAVLRLIAQIEEELDARGRPVSCCQYKGAIKILTDSEALRYRERRQQQKRTGYLRDHRSIVHIDRDSLSERERQKHTFLMLAGANVLAGMKQGLKLARKGLAYNQVMPTKLKDIRARQKQIEQKRV